MKFDDKLIYFALLLIFNGMMFWLASVNYQNWLGIFICSFVCFFTILVARLVV